MSDARRRFLVRGSLVAALAIVALGVTIGPSLAGSFLTKKKANNLYVRKSDAGQFLTQADAAKFETKADAANFITKSDAAADAVETATSTHNGVFGNPAFSSNSTGNVPIGEATVTVPAGQSATLVATFSGQSICTGAVNGIGCGILFLVDGSDASIHPATPSANNGFGWDVTGQPAIAHSVTVSAAVGPGEHTVGVEYNGVASGGYTDAISYWHLLVQAFPT